jgi:uncharacterized membrane protein YhaH (DUF805 family)
MKKSLAFSLLRKVALVVLFIGAVGSFYLTLREGRNDKSILEIFLFLVWVISPFLALFIASAISKKWADITRKAVYILMLVITPFSLISYSGALKLPGMSPAFVFLIVPPLTWLLMAIVIPIAESLSRKKTRRGKSAG